MDIFVYSDESGVFDKSHNDFFVFGGVIFLSKEAKDICSRKYSNAEGIIRTNCNIPKGTEVKASSLGNTERASLYRSLNSEYKFGVVVEQKQLLDRIFACKKDKQRYLDFAYKIGIKRYFQKMIHDGILKPKEIKNLRFFIDEHSTATNGCYELREALEREFKNGTYKWDWNQFYEPIFPSLSSLQVEFCNSESRTLIRAADIVANRIYFLARKGDQMVDCSNNLFVSKLP